MSSNDNILNINTEELAADASKAGATAAASAPRVVVPPPSTVSSELDAAAVSVIGAIKGVLAAVNGNDHAAADKQAAMLAESPQVIAQQDHQAAGTYTTAAGPIREFPMPAVKPGSDAGQVWTV